MSNENVVNPVPSSETPKPEVAPEAPKVSRTIEEKFASLVKLLADHGIHWR